MPMLYQSNQLKKIYLAAEASFKQEKSHFQEKKTLIKNHVGLLLMSNLFVSSKLCKKTGLNNNNAEAVLTKPNQKNLWKPTY